MGDQYYEQLMSDLDEIQAWAKDRKRFYDGGGGTEAERDRDHKNAENILNSLLALLEELEKMEAKNNE